MRLDFLHNHDALRPHGDEQHSLVDEADRKEALRKIAHATKWFKRWYTETGECPNCCGVSRHDDDCELAEWIDIPSGKIETPSEKKISSGLMIVACEAGDWEGLYVDGKLVTEGHQLTTDDILQYADVSCDAVCVSNKDMEAMGCSLPDKLDDLIMTENLYE